MNSFHLKLFFNMNNTNFRIRPYSKRELARLYFPDMLFQGPETLGDALRQRGVVLRSCSNYPGLDGSWYRTAVRTGPENDELLKTLAEVLA